MWTEVTYEVAVEALKSNKKVQTYVALTCSLVRPAHTWRDVVLEGSYVLWVDTVGNKLNPILHNVDRRWRVWEEEIRKTWYDKVRLDKRLERSIP